MALIVVGGSSRGVGKTSVVVEIIDALADYRWTAFKVTHWHDVDIPAGQKAIRFEKKRRLGDSDTSRYLAAGAEHAYLIEATPESLSEVAPLIRRLGAKSRNAIVESNSVMQVLQPDLYLLVLDPASEDFKASAREFLPRADALIVHEVRGGNEMDLLAPFLTSSRQQTVFPIRPPHYVTPGIIEFIKRVLSR